LDFFQHFGLECLIRMHILACESDTLYVLIKHIVAVTLLFVLQ